MKIAFVTASVSRKAGGLHESVRRLAQSMEASASRIEVLGLQDEHTDADVANWASLPVRAFDVIGPKQLGYAPALASALESSDVSLVMSHGLWMYPSAAVCRWHKRTSRPHIVHPHGMLDPWAVRNSRWKKRIAEVLYEYSHLESSACIRALCQSEARAIRDYGLTNPIAIIPNGIDLPDADHGPPTIDHGPLTKLKASGRKVLLYLGRIHPKKGLVNLLRAWKSVVSSPASRGLASEWTLALAGWDQEGHEADLEQLATSLNLRWSDARAQHLENSPLSTLNFQLLFLGPQFGSDKASCYHNCDAFILPSYSEGLPMVVLEAWAYSRPVLMTPECNLPEGFAANAAVSIETNPDSIARGLAELLRLPAFDLGAIGARGRSLVADRFSWPKIAAEMKQVCEWALGAGTKPTCLIG